MKKKKAKIKLKLKKEEAEAGKKEIKVKEEKKEVIEKAPQPPQATFDFQLENITRAEPISTTPMLEIKPEAKAKAEFNLEEFLDGMPIKETIAKEKKYVSKPDYSIEKYVKDQGVERKYVDSAKEWRESIVAKTEQVKELFPTPAKRARLREETMTIESSREEIETRLSPQEAIEYEYKLRFEETGDWHKKEKRIKKYEIVK